MSVPEDQQSAQTPQEVSPLSDDVREQLLRAGRLAKTTFGGDGRLLANFADEWTSGDGATAYVLLSTEDGSERLFPVAGEAFSPYTFESGDWPEFHQAPYDIYVVKRGGSSSDSREVAKRQLLRDNPREYLRQNAWMVARAGQVTRANRLTVKDDYQGYRLDLEYDIQPIAYDEFMVQTRNLAVNTSEFHVESTIETEPMTPELFDEFMTRVPRAVDKLPKFISQIESAPGIFDLIASKKAITEADKIRLRDRACLDLLVGMGINVDEGVSVGYEPAMQSIIDLASKWDSTTKAFRE